MKLYHTTTKDAFQGIQARWGILTSLSQGKDPVVWTHTASKIHWAISHVQRRHNVALDQVVVLRVQVPRSWLRRAWKGIWKCSRDIPRDKIRVVGTGYDLAASPVEGE